LTKEGYENLDYQLLYFVLSDSVPSHRLSGCCANCFSDGIEGLTSLHHNLSSTTDRMGGQLRIHLQENAIFLPAAHVHLARQ